MALYLVRFMLEPRVNLAAIATRRAPSRLLSLQNSYIDATLSKVKGRREAGKAAAHHDDARALVAAKRRCRDRIPRGFGIKAAGQPAASRFDRVCHDCPIARSDQSNAVLPLMSARSRWGTIDLPGRSHKSSPGIAAVRA
jgi:hypothetical protein